MLLTDQSSENSLIGKVMYSSVAGIEDSFGYWVDVFPHLEKETLDLSTRFIFTSSGKTNFVAAVRAHIPYGQTLLIFDVRHPVPALHRMGFLITVDNDDGNGNKISQRAFSH